MVIGSRLGLGSWGGGGKGVVGMRTGGKVWGVGEGGGGRREGMD